MSQSLSAIHVHLVFSTKNHKPCFHDASLRANLHKFLGGASKKLDCPSHIVGGVEDHIHLLGRLGRSISVADWVKELKRASNQWLKEQGPEFKKFEW
jgi:putative transposase